MKLQNWMVAVTGAISMMILAACQTASPRTAEPIAQPTAQVQTSATTNAAYNLGNGDRLRVTVFGEEDMSGEFLVDSTGQVSIPLVGEVPAAGRSVRNLSTARQ